MSGPKSITYTVTPELWEQLCEMRRKERKLHAVWNRFYEKRQRLASLCMSLRELSTRLLESFGEFSEAEALWKKTEEQRKKAEAAMERVRDITMDYGGLSEEEKTDKTFETRTEKLKEANAYLYEVVKECSRFCEACQEKEAQFQAKMEEQLMNSIREGFQEIQETGDDGDLWEPDDAERQEMVQDYVSRCIDEVMEEMGYVLSGKREVTKRSGRHFKNELFSYSEGCAISVTTSEDGQIAMELGGLDVADREPDAKEQAYLAGKMEQFCHDFSEFERRLWEKGVVPKRHLSMLPPSGAYAQIINTEEFEMTKTLPLLEISRNNRKGRKRWQR